MSFDPTLATPRDRIRSQVGDTSGDPATELLPDDTYDAWLAYHGNDETLGLLAVANSLIAKYSQQASRINLGDMEFSWRDRMVAWKAIVTRLSSITTNNLGGGFSVVRPSRDEISQAEYERASIYFQDEPWFNGD